MKNEKGNKQVIKTKGNEIKENKQRKTEREKVKEKKQSLVMEICLMDYGVVRGIFAVNNMLRKGVKDWRLMDGLKLPATNKGLAFAPLLYGDRLAHADCFALTECHKAFVLSWRSDRRYLLHGDEVTRAVFQVME